MKTIYASSFILLHMYNARGHNSGGNHKLSLLLSVQKTILNICFRPQNHIKGCSAMNFNLQFSKKPKCNMYSIITVHHLSYAITQPQQLL